MSTYIVLLRYTTQGIGKIKGGPARLEAAKKLYKDKGCTLKSFYMTLGQYDGVSIVEAPDDKTMTEATITISSQGNVSTETLRAFTEDEYREIIGSLP